MRFTRRKNDSNFLKDINATPLLSKIWCDAAMDITNKGSSNAKINFSLLWNFFVINLPDVHCTVMLRRSD
jgi:hypothetical protein